MSASCHPHRKFKTVHKIQNNERNQLVHRRDINCRRAFASASHYEKNNFVFAVYTKKLDEGTVKMLSQKTKAVTADHHSVSKISECGDQAYSFPVQFKKKLPV
jgi:hypothetical protein